jgi:hypothetical protein
MPSFFHDLQEAIELRPERAEMEPLFPKKEPSVQRRRGAWLEHKDKRECISWFGNKLSQSLETKVLLIRSSVVCDLSLLHIKG